jgi:type I restriction enzyme M protein
MPEAALLHCPIRGNLRVRQRTADQLTFTEEKQRIDAVRYLIQRNYPKENFGIETTLFRIGNAGRNSFRTDFAVYDQPFDDLRSLPLQKRLDHVRVLAEIKRDNSNAEQAKATQVRAALQLVPDIETLGVYWDDVEQRFFYRRIEGKRSIIHDAPISKIPGWGSGVGSTRLVYSDLEPAKDLVRIFDEIEDALHTYIVDKAERYTLIQQLLLLKIHDENIHRSGRKKTLPLEFQDYTVEALSDTEVLRRMNDALASAAAHYNLYLPSTKRIDEKFRCRAEALRNATKILAPVNILGSKVQVIQQFYMKFAKSLYKWDLAQYFTPHEVIDFIVELTNPKPGEHVYDPACGSADFLISAFRRAGTSMETCVWGADNSEQAVQISILNMVLNGDGKTQIKNQDSLSAYTSTDQQFSVVLCNPPFGTKIVERRYEVLRKFDMGHKWIRSNIGVTMTDSIRDAQQTGILFAELCVRLAKPGGRVGIILPNGYLGNRGVEYVALREWILRHTRLVGIVAFPRFTFKKSGADVSASVVLLERRKKPLMRASESADYVFFVGNIESVGWRAGDKKAVPVYLRDQMSGELILNDENEPILDADFESILNSFLHSPAADCFRWTIEDRNIPNGPQTQGVDITDVATLYDLNLDPKRHSSKFKEAQREIRKFDHFRLGDVLDIVSAMRVKIEPERIYKYVEIERVGVGEYDYTELRGWQLPSRAKLIAKPRDIFIPHVWGCAGKWFIAAGDCKDLIVTNGCTRLQIKEGMREILPDLVVGLCSEAFCVQMRALATGSDGLAEITDDDLLNIILPKRLKAPERERVEKQLEPILTGESKFAKFAKTVIDDIPNFPMPPPRKSHCALI